MDMKEVVTKNDLMNLEARLDRRIEKAVEDIALIIHDFSEQVAGEFTKAKIKRDELRASIDRLTNTLVGFAKRVEDAEAETAARDAQFHRLVDWAKMVSEKTGIPLPAELV